MWTWLQKIGQDIVSVFKKAEPIIQVAQNVAKPFEDVYAPGLSSVIQLTLNKIVDAEALAAAAGVQNGSGAVKLAYVTSSIIPQIAPILATMGVQSVSSTQYNNFVSALVAAMNAFTTTSGPAASGSGSTVGIVAPNPSQTPPATTGIAAH
jgi:hypothetical protein